MKTITERMNESYDQIGEARKELNTKIDEFNAAHQDWIDTELKQPLWGLSTFLGDHDPEISLEDVISVDPHVEIDGKRQEVMYVDRKYAGSGLYSLRTKQGGMIFASETPQKLDESNEEGSGIGFKVRRTTEDE